MPLPSVINHSGIPHNKRKFDEMPVGVEEVEGYRDQIAPDGMSATKVFQMPWPIRYAFLRWAIGYSWITNDSLDPEGTNWRMSRVVPVQHPEYPWLYASAANMVGVAGRMGKSLTAFYQDAPARVSLPPPDNRVDLMSSPLPETVQGQEFTPIDHVAYYTQPPAGPHGKAVYSVTYTARPYEVRDDAELATMDRNELNRYVQRQPSFATQSISLTPANGGQLKFTEGPLSGSVVPANGQQLLYPKSVWKYTWHDLPDLPWAAMAATVGRCNRTTFDGLRGAPTHPPETLLCMAPEAPERYRGVTGHVYWRITFNFMAVTAPNATWNKAPSPTDGLWYAIRYGGAANLKVYPDAPFEDLFKVYPAVRYQ